MSATILAIDDDESNLQLLRDVCEASGWQVATEKEGTAGLERARAFRWDAVADATVAVYREALA